MRTVCLNILMKEPSDRYPDYHLAVVWDGAASHRCNDLEIPDHMTLIPLPPYSPQHNPQANVWREIKPEGFCNRVFNSKDDVKIQWMTVLKQCKQQPQRLQSLTAFHWILEALNSLNWYHSLPSQSRP